MNIAPSPPCEGRSTTALIACGVVIEGCWLTVLGLGNLREHLPTFVAIFGVAFGAYGLAVWLTLAGHAVPPLRLILVAAVAFRLTLLVAPPTLSDDLYRSVWEGRVLLHGFSPYRSAPDAPELASLRDTVWDGVNNKTIPSPYPPLAQLYSVATAIISPTSVAGPKLLSTLLDVGVILVLLTWLRTRGLPDRAVLVYAWAPLAALEFAHSGHNDALMVLLLVAALALTHRRYLGAALLALATLAKIAPVVVAPLLVRRWGPGPSALFGGLVVLGYAPLLALGGGAPGSLLTYAATWSDNDSLFFLLRSLFWPLAGASPGPAKAVSALLLVAGLTAIAIHPRSRAWPVHRQALAALGLFLLLSSTVHAWYATWLLPLLALELKAADRSIPLEPAWAVGWLLFSGLAALPYLTYADHAWEPWISVAEYAPLYALLGLGAWQWRRPEQTAAADVPASFGTRSTATVEG